jgi:peptide/nickel transport system permease protein
MAQELETKELKGAAPATAKAPAHVPIPALVLAPAPEFDIEPGTASRPSGLGRFIAYRPGLYSFILIGLVLALALLAPAVAPHARDAIDLNRILAAPTPEHVLGTDDLGRDVLSRLLYAARFSMLVALSAVAIATAIGILMGTLSGYLGGRADAAVTLVMDLFLSVPVFLLLLVAASLGGGRLWFVPVIIGATSWVETARIVRALVLSLKGEGFVAASRAAGARDVGLVARHLLPQTIPSIIVSAAVGFAQAMLAESALSFLGYGVQPPVPTWGNMLENAQVFMREAPLAAFAPGFMIFITCLACNYLGEGLRRALAIER